MGETQNVKKDISLLDKHWFDCNDYYYKSGDLYYKVCETPRKMLLYHILNHDTCDNCELKAIHYLSGKIVELTDLQLELFENILNVIAGSVFYIVWEAGDFKLYHEYEISIPIPASGKKRCLKFDFDYYLILNNKSELDVGYMNNIICVDSVYTKNIYGYKIPYNVRDVIKMLVMPADEQHKCLDNEFVKLIVKTLYENKFYLMLGRVYHKSELPGIEKFVDSYCEIKRIAGIYIITVNDEFARVYFKQIAKYLSVC